LYCHIVFARMLECCNGGCHGGQQIQEDDVKLCSLVMDGISMHKTQWLLLLLLLLLIEPTVLLVDESSNSNQKVSHVVFVVINDLGWNDVGYHQKQVSSANSMMGYPTTNAATDIMEMPILDHQLVAEGVSQVGKLLCSVIVESDLCQYHEGIILNIHPIFQQDKDITIKLGMKMVLLPMSWQHAWDLTTSIITTLSFLPRNHFDS
jgi:hypothetical protein